MMDSSHFNALVVCFIAILYGWIIVRFHCFFITHVYFNTVLKHARYSLTDSINGKKDVFASVPPDLEA